MYFYLAKFLPVLLMPLSLTLMLLALAALFAKRAPGFSRLAVVAALLLLWAASTPLVAEGLYGRLESGYEPLSMADTPVAECVVVLGGAVSPPVPPRVEVEIRERSDRAVHAARLYHAGKVRHLVLSAGNKPLTVYDEATATEAELLRGLLRAWGVPDAVIVPEPDSRNTRENALNSAPLLAKLGCGSPLLVTSAAHMHRAVRSFEAIGVEVVPVPVDFLVVDAPRATVEWLVPDAAWLDLTSRGMHEWLGRVLYRFRGWN